MKVTKLVVGIIMIVLAIIIFVQSLISGFGNSNAAIHIYAGTAELIVALLYLASGIVYIATCGIDGLGGDIAGLSMMLISWILGLLTCKIYLPLQLWAWLALIIGVGFFVWHIMLRRE
ncbi:hypothetical protein LTY36_08485 [Limosilactobacillus agrestis]|uniref:Uncharacterized protein n=1 Tax=Limosilactobacillus agrestis TaxID=2759748 RepID=A0A7W3UI89_9LACO|nr:hypothetical protein [Limosilactobacillus agrestis]MBD5090336.1 hypothetical protein [Lactobacillus sp.]MBB1096057.1 hypothetical protein [Limosilactobacillus agrestis]MBB1100041.1 hypothetical protein [Limosilactobacillus agrestis]MCD7113368.1 hypothetical protein [Limosilactobacillus agrestis]MCD7120732.1 hypothetical protein [Limosilactobacillus agrestis]